MTWERKLKAIYDLIRSEAQNNPDFRDRLSEILIVSSNRNTKSPANNSKITNSVQRRNRRTPATLDPISEIQKGEQHLRILLFALNLEQLRDVVAEYRMDPNKLVMKWQDREKVIDHIIMTAQTRGQKGDAFRA